VDVDLEDHLSTTTPDRAFRRTVTAEPSPRMSDPTPRAIFSVEVDRIE
jgi:hypothetical protein